MYVRHVGHSGSLLLLAGGRWEEVWATLDAAELRLDGAVAHGGMRVPVAALAGVPVHPSSANCDRLAREHTFELQLACADRSAVHLASRTRSELHAWLLRLSRALRDLRRPPAAEPAEVEPALRPDQLAWPHGTAGVPSLVSPSYPAWVEGPRPQPWRGRSRAPTFQWAWSEQELLAAMATLPPGLQALDGRARAQAGAARELHGRAARVDKPFDAANPWAAAGHVRGSERGRAVALLQGSVLAQRKRAAQLEPLEPREPSAGRAARS